MNSETRHSPPNMSPYQRAIKSGNMSQPSNYPSPARSDSEPSKYPVDGLGLYNYALPLAPSGPPTIYPPSPQLTESWAHQTSGASPLMTDASVESWSSLYDRPMSRSPLPWNSGLPFSHSRFMDGRPSPEPAHHTLSQRSSFSSPQTMSIYSHKETDSIYAPVKVETGSEWTTDGEVSPGHSLDGPLTVSPDRLSTGIFPYTPAYGCAQMPKYEPMLDESYDSREYNDIPYVSRRRAESKKDGTHRTRIRRNPTTPENANYKCHVCGKLFQRSYNHKTHMEIHDPAREFPHPCTYPQCNKKFVRRTDLVRHERSVHVKAKDFQCGACDARFARKDTLRRHEEDGCPKRNELHDGRLLRRTLNPVKSEVAQHHQQPPLSYHPVHMSEPSHYASRSPSLHVSALFRDDNSYHGSPSGY
ncbi:hypothetical protein GQ43DRAFT_430091 [Delitschia confertaspora ATCC 74209]|uniref:C2H2-type domain-containing protein n=1 Tax=Delitschia confertaspora ATCC 74209 TaxID=1513339 RepID=A0A9P4JPW0_9PLEO|nr:hypothetical protein GQ43DRAFT_430091 [Delitschia confertaspora ATCC 74209]